MSRPASDIAADLVALRQETREAVAQAKRDEADWARLRDTMNAITSRYSQSSSMIVQEQLRPNQLVNIVLTTMKTKAREFGERCLQDDQGDVTQEAAVDAVNMVMVACFCGVNSTHVRSELCRSHIYTSSDSALVKHSNFLCAEHACVDCKVIVHEIHKCHCGRHATHVASTACHQTNASTYTCDAHKCGSCLSLSDPRSIVRD